MVVGESKRFDYTGNIQTIVLEPGKYKLECYGAQGYAILNGTGGKGSYAQGEIIIRKKETLYICVGGLNTGYNGGEGDVPGGGATHIARRTGLLKTLVNYKDLVLIVAGGGGGAERITGGAGGGLTGDSGSGGYDYLTRNGAGGTQTNGGRGGNTSNYGDGQTGGFGYGGHGNAGDSGPTGGGGWYGGGGVTYAGGAGGGSSYISHPELQNASTTTGVRIGNGYAIITLLDDNKRKNSNLYKDSYNQETFDFNKLLEV